MMAMSMHGVHVSYSPADQGRSWNFQVSGAYPQVMPARGMLLKGTPIQVRNSPRTTWRIAHPPN